MSTAPSDRLAAAHAADSTGDVLEAARLYEALNAECQLSPQAYADAICLNWQMTDFGYSTAKNLSPEAVRVAGDRLSALLQKVESKYPQHPELSFWRRYIRWADSGQAYLVEEAERALVDHPACRLPLVYIAQQPRIAGKYLREIERLRDEYSNPRTHREQYVYTTLTSALKRIEMLARSGRRK